MKDLLIKESKIAGKGVFVAKPLSKGQIVYLLKGESCTLDEIIRRVNAGQEEASDPLGIGPEQYLDLDETLRTFNHSCSPNAFIREKSELVAMRDIAVGEEITYDYSTTMNDNEQKIKDAGRKLWTCSCNCGSKNCRGIIDQFKTLPEETKDFYIKNRYMPDYMLEVFSSAHH